jgi:hypothetical protein
MSSGGCAHALCQGTWQFMAIPILKKPYGHLHTEQDDIESVVYLLWYHVLRYCAAYDPEGTWRPLAKRAIEGIFDSSLALSPNNIQGGDAKESFFDNHVVKAEDVRKAIRPMVLVSLMQNLRELYADVYADEPMHNKRNVHDNWKGFRDEALAKLQDPSTIIAIFDSYLTGVNEMEWPDADSAVDFLAHARPTKVTISDGSLAVNAVAASSVMLPPTIPARIPPSVTRNPSPSRASRAPSRSSSSKRRAAELGDPSAELQVTPRRSSSKYAKTSRAHTSARAPSTSSGTPQPELPRRVTRASSNVAVAAESASRTPSTSRDAPSDLNAAGDMHRARTRSGARATAATGSNAAGDKSRGGRRGKSSS